MTAGIKFRGLSKADLQLWAAFTQNIFVLPGKSRLAVEPDATPVAGHKLKLPPIPKPSAQIGPLNTDQAPAGLDKSSWKNFSTGKTKAARRLDLHGLTATRAHSATTGFILNAYAEQIRCIEIITGKGEVLARELPHWLNTPQLRPLILATAHPNPANPGAIRILVRRSRA